MRGLRRLLRLEHREGPMHAAAFSEESTKLTEKIKEALIFERVNLCAGRDDPHSVGKCLAGRAVSRVSRTVCVCGHEWPGMSAYLSRRIVVNSFA